jgi:cytochrome P450
MSVKKRVPPGPKGQCILGSLKDFRSHPLSFLESCRNDYGDIVHVKIINKCIYLISSPELIEWILVKNSKNYSKDTRGVKKLKKLQLFGEGLVFSSGELWRRQRKIIQPAFHHTCITTFSEHMIESTDQLITHLRTETKENQPVNWSNEITQLTLDIVIKTLFGTDQPIPVGLKSMINNFMGESNKIIDRVVPLPLWLPTPSNRIFHRSKSAFFAYIKALIHSRLQEEEPSPDLLSMLLFTVDEAGNRMSIDQLISEIQTFILAGHDTTANLLKWVFYLLGKYPDSEVLVREEMEQCDMTQPVMEWIKQLPYTKAVLQETLRLYPSAWLLPRSPITDDTLNGYPIPAGASVMISPYVVHRDPRFWTRPTQFDPSRFLETPMNSTLNYTYIPFGAGPRQCIGKEFAMMEAIIILSKLMTTFKFECLTQEKVSPITAITLQPDKTLMFRVSEQ